MLTDAELQGIGAQTSNMAIRELEKGNFNFLLATYNLCDQPPLHRMDAIEELIIARLGDDWLNSGRKKDMGFHVLRLSVHLMPPDALAVVTMANGFRPTAKLFELPPEERERWLNGGHDRHHLAVQQGLLEVCDVLVATIQSPERVCLYQHEIDQRRQLTGTPSTKCFPQSEFRGRLKMFGAKEEEIRWEHQA